MEGGEQIMATIDDKVVAMSFENSKFESGASKTMGTLGKLKHALNFTGASKGMEQISSSANKVDLSHISKGVDTIRSRLSLLQVGARAIFASIAVQAFYTGARLLKSLTLDPILQGFQEYETKIGAVQTILSNTAASGVKLQDVNKALAQLNTYADKTIYNFTEMTRNIGTFTAAGVDLKTAVASIKGIANLAALSGSNAQQASTAMYQLSQAISAGRVSLQDWNSVVNAGMGGTIFQRALVETAVHMGALNKSAVKLTGSMKNVTVNGQSFRQSIQASPGKQSWLTGKVLTETLAQLSGSLTDAQLKAKGYSAAQIKAIQTQAKAALAAATQVKTLSQLLDTTKEAIGSGWANTFQIIFGDFGQAKVLFTGLSNTINRFVSHQAKARNKVLKDWSKLGGRTLLIDSLGKMAQAIGAVLKPIKEAFRDIFPRKTGADLLSMTQSFARFVDTMKPAPATVENVRRTFRGLFAAFDIIKQAIGGLIGFFGKLFGAMGVGSGGILNFTGNIGDFITSLDLALKRSNAFGRFFSGLAGILAVPLHVLGQIAHAIGNLFSGFNAGALGGIGGGLSGIFAGLGKSISSATKAWHAFLTNAVHAVWPFVQNVGRAFSKIGDVIQNAFHKINWSAVLGTAAIAIGAGFLITFRKIFKGFSVQDLGEGIIGKLTGPFEALTGSLTTMQRSVKAKILLEIAAAIGIVTASIIGLSLIKPKALDNALSGLGIAFAELLGAMKTLDFIGKSGAFLKMPIIAGAMVILAGAIGILTLSVKSLSNLDWNSLVKGLTGVGVLLGEISLSSILLSKNSAGMITAGLGITEIAIAMKILASAVKSFGQLDLGTLAKGLVAVGASLVTIGLATKLFPPRLLAIGAGLAIVGGGLKILASAVKSFGGMDVATLAKGIFAIGSALVILAGAMRIMPPGLALQAAGLVLISIALKGISSAVVKMGGQDLGTIAKGLVALGGALGILAIGTKAMAGSLRGAAAIAVVSAGMMLLAPALKIMGGMSWGEIAKGMATLAISMGILGAAGLLLGPVAPAVLALGVALLAIGGALALAGLGIAGIGVGLSAIAVAGPTAISILLKAVTGLIQQIPLFAVKFGQGFVKFVEEIAKAGPKIVTALVKILDTILNAIIIDAPKFAKAFGVLINAALTLIEQNFPRLVHVGLEMLLSLLKGIDANIARIAKVGADIIIRFLNSISTKVASLTAAGLNVLVKFLAGIAKGLPKVLTAGASIIVNLFKGIANNTYRIITAAASIPIKMVTAIGNAATSLVGAGANAIVNFLTGLAKRIPDIFRAAANLVVSFLLGLGIQLPKIIDAGFRFIVSFINGIATSIKAHAQQMIDAGINLGAALAEGFGRGIGSSPAGIAKTVFGFGKGIIEGFLNIFGIGSPSKVTTRIGEQLIEGLAVGIRNTSSVTRAISRIKPVIVNAFTAIVIALSRGVSASVPQINRAFANALRQALNTLRAGASSFIVIGILLVTKLFTGITSSLGLIVAAAALIIPKFLAAITSRMGQIVSTGVNVVAGFLRGILAGTSKIVTAGSQTILDLLKGMENSLPRLLTAASQIPIRMVSAINNTSPKLVSAGITAIGHFLTGLAQSIPRVQAMGATIIGALAAAIGGSVSALNAMGIVAVANFMGGVNSALINASNSAKANGILVGQAIDQGIIGGLNSMGVVVAYAAIAVVNNAITAAKHAAGIKSPSTVMMEFGRNMGKGLAEGITGGTGVAVAAAKNLATNVIAAMDIAFGHGKHQPKILTDFGAYVANGFRKGLLSEFYDTTVPASEQAVSDLKNRLTTQIGNLKQHIHSETDKLNTLLKEKHPNKKAIHKLRTEIETDNKVLTRLDAANTALTKHMAAKRKELVSLTKAYDDVTTKLDAANQALADAKQARDEAVSGFKDQYSTLPDLVTNKATQLPRYISALKQQVAATRMYGNTLAKLRKLGLDDATYRKLLAEGPADQSFASQILSGGKKAVGQLNSLDKKLGGAAESLATTAGNNLYQAGVDAAQGIVDGLVKKQSDIRKAMEDIATEIVRAIRKKLKIKSPSQVFAEMGGRVIEGLAVGIEANTSNVTTAVDKMAQKLADSMGQIPDAFNKMTEIEPTITPILDLGAVEQEAQRLRSMLSANPIRPTASYRHASSVSIPNVKMEESTSSSVPAINFEQNNYSPQALTPIEIYRQTKNQLSLAKRALEDTRVK
jgi:tape measure domain-containing protein